MEITITLSEILELTGRRLNGWEDFCEEFGISVYAVNSGYGDTTVTLTKEQAEKHGII
ncbi:hypothetical protein NVP1121O_025 [Vibrio phage 1.121.O._10N.286.46.C4]|nr:hypothetical protein NVP1121O_025 [Vibrio phage 1.121.O._10N.286.46.C4]